MRKRSRAHNESWRRKLRRLLTDDRLAQSPLEVQKGSRGHTNHGRNCESCEFAEVTRTKPGIDASRRAGENAGAELLGAGVKTGWKDIARYRTMAATGFSINFEKPRAL